MQTKCHKEDIKAYHEQVGDHRTGHRNTKALLFGREGRPDNYKLGYGGAGSNEDWTTPRHRHTFEQIRYVGAGEYVLRDNEVLPTGWVAYFPESCYYGPQIKRADCDLLTLQFGGPSGLGYWSTAERRQAHDALLAKGGKFENGVYTWLDDKGRRHNQDAAEAVEAQARGHAVEYPTPRYKDIVLMNPDAYAWVDDRKQPGVSRKHLGTFSEREIRVAFLRLEKGASLAFGTEPSNEVMFLKSGALTHDNIRYGELTAFGTEPEEKPVTLQAVEPSELVYIKMPTF